MRFSIIIPIYKVERFLCQCVDSVLKQTYQDYELILVDDGSPDRCGQIIDRYAAQDQRVIAIHKENGGVVSARKTGARAAKGEYVIILDGDDWLAENALERLAQAIVEKCVDVICYGHYEVRPDNCRTIRIVNNAEVLSRNQIEEQILSQLLLGNKEKKIFPTLWGKAYKRELYQIIQQTVDDRITMGEDGVVVYPLLCRVKTMCILPDVLYFYRINPDSMTQSNRKLISWENVSLRIWQLKNNLPMDQYGMERQLGCYAAHAAFNALETQFRHKKYADVKKEAVETLTKYELIPLIKKARMIGSIPEKLAQIAIVNKWFFVIKLYAMLG